LGSNLENGVACVAFTFDSQKTVKIPTVKIPLGVVFKKLGYVVNCHYIVTNLSQDSGFAYLQSCT